MGEFSSITRTGKHEPFELHVQRGYVQGHSVINKFGYATSVSGTEVPIWNGGSPYVYPTSAGLVNVVATSGTNTTSQILIQGLDENYDEITNIVTLNGTTTVASTDKFIRVYRAYVVNDVPLANTVNLNLDGNLTAVIYPADNQTLMAIYTIPAGYTGYLSQLNISSGTAQPTQFIRVRLKVREPDGVFRTQAKYSIANSFAEESYPYPIPIPEKSDIQVTGISSGGVNEIAALFNILLIKNVSA